MSLLSDPRHTVEVQPHEPGEDSFGETWVPVGPRVTVGGSLQPQTSTEEGAYDIQALELYIFICREWPYGPHTRVYHEGQEYEQIGAPRRYRMSARTSHDDVILRAVGTDG